MYKILHFVFGWDYVFWQNSCYHGIARVYQDGEGKPYYYRYKSIKLIDQLPNRWFKIVWLTCSPSKYGIE